MVSFNELLMSKSNCGILVPCNELKGEEEEWRSMRLGHGNLDMHECFLMPSFEGKHFLMAVMNHA